MDHDPRMTIAAQATGIHDYTGFRHSVRPVPDELANAYIPPQYVVHRLQALGAAGA